MYNHMYIGYVRHAREYFLLSTSLLHVLVKRLRIM